MNPYEMTMAIPVDLVVVKMEPRLLDAARAMGLQVRMAQRKAARDAGMAKLPGAVIYVGSRCRADKLVLPEEDVTVMLPGETQ